jgi:hypothetical protein
MIKKSKQSKTSKSHTWAPLSGPQGGSETTFFCANSKSKIIASVGGAYASKDKMVRIWAIFKKN